MKITYKGILDKAFEVLGIITLPYIFILSIIANLGYYQKLFFRSLLILLVIWLVIGVCKRRDITIPPIYRFIIAVTTIIVSTSSVSIYILNRKGELHNPEWTYFVYVDAAVLLISMIIYVCKKELFDLGLRLTSLLVLLTGVWGYIDYIKLAFEYINKDRAYVLSYRPFSIYMNPIPAGQIFLMFLWIPFFMGKREPDKKEQIINAVIRTIVYVPFIILTKSRSIWLGLILTAAVWFIIYRKSIVSSWKQLSIKKKYICATLMAATACVGIPAFIKIVIARFTGLKSQQPYYLRLNYIRYTLEQYANTRLLRKIFGHGPGRSKDMITASPYFEPPYNICDNAYMSMLYEWGIIAIIAVIVIYIFAFKILIDFAKEKRKNIAVYCAFAVIACIIPIFFYEAQMWFMVGTPMAIFIAGGVYKGVQQLHK